jgi:hypothetical protein
LTAAGKVARFVIPNEARNLSVPENNKREIPHFARHDRECLNILAALE